MESVESIKTSKKGDGAKSKSALTTRSRSSRNPKPADKVKQLQFITSTASPADAKTDIAARRVIRSQARKSGNQKNQDLAIRSASAEKGREIVPSFNKKLHTSRFKLSSWSRKQPKKEVEDEEPANHTDTDEEAMMMALDYLEDRGYTIQSMDAPNLLPIPLVPQIKSVIHYCKVILLSSYKILT
jgi:hypothetical protein